MSLIARHRTAIERVALSRPVRLALADGLIRSDTLVFDYGCGRGGDLARLTALGIACDGWDPVHRPNVPRTEADVVNLGYVVNVIEDPDERTAALRAAWMLARSVLIVAARLEAEARPEQAVDLHDGYVTRRGTFQKLYDQHELRTWLESTLGALSAPAGPGVFYVFRDPADQQRFLAQRQHRVRDTLRVDRPTDLYEKHKETLRPLFDFLCMRGRLPQLDELAEARAMLDTFGTIQRAYKILLSVVDEQQWAEAVNQRRHDLLIYLALSRFTERPRLSDLPLDLQHDIRAFFKSYQAACEESECLLFSAGDMALVDRLCRQSKVGKLTPEALYVHRSALSELDPVLRTYEGCAQAYIGYVEDANLIKLNRRTPQVSYLTYPDFDSLPHPALLASLLVPLKTFRIELRHYDPNKNPPILHRKEQFVPTSYPLREKFARLTAQEERYGLYESPQHIGTRAGWLAELQKKGVTLRGHRIVRAVLPMSADQ